MLTSYLLTFASSWGGLLSVIGGPRGLPATAERFTRLMPFVILAAYAGPSVARLLSSGLLEGKAGYRAVLARPLRWRAGAHWL